MIITKTNANQIVQKVTTMITRLSNVCLVFLIVRNVELIRHVRNAKTDFIPITWIHMKKLFKMYLNNVCYVLTIASTVLPIRQWLMPRWFKLMVPHLITSQLATIVNQDTNSRITYVSLLAADQVLILMNLNLNANNALMDVWIVQTLHLAKHASKDLFLIKLQRLAWENTRLLNKT